MISETIPVTVGTQYGALYVAVIHALEDSYFDSQNGSTTVLRPRVRVATDPAFTANSDGGSWTIRRRAYTLHRTFYYHDVNGGQWQKESNPHEGGYRNDKGGQLDVCTATYDLMSQATMDALATFAAAYPQWQEFSRFLLLDAKRSYFLHKAADMLRQAEAAETKAAEMTAEIDPLFNTLPESLTDLIRR